MITSLSPSSVDRPPLHLVSFELKPDLIFEYLRVWCGKQGGRLQIGCSSYKEFLSLMYIPKIVYYLYTISLGI